MSINEKIKCKTQYRVLVTILFLFFSQSVFSASFTGLITFISKTQNDFRINTQTNSFQQEITLSVSSPGDVKLLKRLKIGDYLAFQAQPGTKKGSYTLTSVDYVGLSDLLTVWTSSDGLCYNFTSFSQLIVYPQDEKSECSKSINSNYVGFPKTFKYFITPNESSWDILVSDSDLYFSAEFYFQTSAQIFARIFNTDTGKIDSELMFWR